MQPISLKTIAAEFGISPIHLGKIFRDGTGHKFNDYLNEFRIGKARQLLQVSAGNAADIARHVGYADPNYFYKIFHRLTGYTVRQYQKSRPIKLGPGSES